MEKPNTASGELWLPYMAVLVLMVAGVASGGRLPTALRPSAGDAGHAELSREEQRIPARLWQDPLEATEAARRALNDPKNAAAAADAVSLADLVKEHTEIDGIVREDKTVDYLAESHRTLFLFVSVPSDPYPEASEQRIRSRVAVVSALSTAGYCPANSSRLGLAVWSASSPDAAITAQTSYPFEVFVFDTERKVLQGEKLARKADEVFVFYVEEGAMQPEAQFEWLSRLSQLLGAASPPERMAKRWILARWLGPNTSDRLAALLRGARVAWARSATDAASIAAPVLPVEVLPVRPTIESRFLQEIVMPKSAGAPSVSGFSLGPQDRHVMLAVRPRPGAQPAPWLTLERLGCHDAMLSSVLAAELRLRRPSLFAEGHNQGNVALVSEWDTLYGRALPQSFEGAFINAGGKREQLQRYTYLRGLDGQTSGAIEKPKVEAAKSAEPADLFHQLMQSSAPSIAYGRTQVDYVDRLAAQLRADEKADPTRRLQAIGILGSDTYDKLLILQGLRKVFPGVQYFTTELDAALFAPEQYNVTRNLLIATGFELRLCDKYQHSILPFRDSTQTATYFGTLHAVEYFTVRTNREEVGAPLEAWTPALIEVARSGPYLLQSPPAANPVTAGPSAAGRSPRPELIENARANWRRWLSPAVALAVIAGSALTQSGRRAVERSFDASWSGCRQLALWRRRRTKWDALGRVCRRMRLDAATWLLFLGAIIFVGVTARIPWIAERPGEEPFFLAEGISSWPATWLRALGIFLCACYFWIIAWHFRSALGRAQRELARTAPECCPPSECPARPTPCEAWDRFCRRSRGWRLKALILLGWATYMVGAFWIFRHLDRPSPTSRGMLSMAWESRVLLIVVFSMNLLIAYAVVHNLSCAFFVRQVAGWLRRPDALDSTGPPLHTGLMRAIGHVAGAMTQMIYYPFTLIFLLIAARQPLFDNFDWPLPLILVFAISSGALLASTMVVRRSADLARKSAVAWLEETIARLRWKQAGGALDKTELRELACAEWQLSQIQQVGGAALSEGLLSNPLLRAVLIPLGGTGVLQAMELFGKVF